MYECLYVHNTRLNNKDQELIKYKVLLINCMTNNKVPNEKQKPCNWASGNETKLNEGLNLEINKNLSGL